MIKRSLLTFLALQVAATGLSWACTCSLVTRYADHERVFVGRAERSAVGCDGTQHTQFIVIEAIEGVDPGPLEAVAATGGRWASSMRWGVLPQVLPVVTSQWLFRFEINVRASTVLGMIGAGGVGSELVSQLVFRNFAAVGAVLIMTIAVVMAIDTASAAVRQRIIRGGTRPGGPDVDDEDRNAAVLADLTGLPTGGPSRDS